MIVFYDKQTGDIQGTINGRIHDEGHLKMWLGNKDEVDRLVVQWKAVDNIELDNGETAVVFEPDLDTKEQRDMFMQLERGELKTKELKIDTTTKNLVKIEV